MIAYKANDYTVLAVQEIFECIDDLNYEEAFFLSSQLMERQETGDTLFHEWVKSLTEFYSCDRKDTAIALLETIKPKIIENEIHFRIINSLMCFYHKTQDEINFMQYKNLLYPHINKINNKELKLKAIVNIANGYYGFKHYEKALEYVEESFLLIKNYNQFDLKFSLAMIVKTMCLLNLGRIEEAESIKQDFLVFIRVTNTDDHIKYLEVELKKFYDAKEKRNEKIIEKDI